MIGVSELVRDQFGDTALLELLGRRSIATGKYDRGAGDTTAPLPLAHHLHYAAKGWQLVAVVFDGGVKPAAPAGR